MSLFRLFLIVLVTAQASQAANILSACSGSSSTCSKTQIYFPCYERSGGVATVPYRVDQGDLGDLSSATATQAVDDMLAMWETVASLNFSKSGTLDVDVTFSNYSTYLEPDSPLGYSPIIFDDDGSIVEQYFGTGSKSSVLGFASSVFFDQNAVTGAIEAIAESHSLYNGFLYTDANRRDLSGADAVLAEFKTTILHEFGHMVGLDHTQGGFINEYNNDTADLDTFPVMFPISANTEIELHRDDIVAINICYPLSSVTSGKGAITGHLTKSAKNVKAGNIIAYNVSNTAEEVVSTASDADGQGTGQFSFPYLTAGDYIIKAERMDSGFSGGSSVGIHSPSTGTFFSSAFYTGDGESPLVTSDLDEGLLSAQRITVTAGGTTDIEFELSPIVDVDSDTTFTLGGKALNQGVLVGFSKKKTKLKITKVGTGARRLSLSSDQPGLVQFRPSTVTIPAKLNSKTVTVVISSYFDVLEVFTDIDSSSAEIPITVEDLDTGYIDNGSVITIF